jgi:hypothetical protein
MKFLEVQSRPVMARAWRLPRCEAAMPLKVIDVNGERHEQS